MAGVEAIVGYAVGTLQIVLIDWWRRIASHRQQLLLLRAELRRLRTFSNRWGWKDGLPPDDADIPLPPVPSAFFVSLVSEVDFGISDELSDDNCQQALLHIVDACSLLQRYHKEVHALRDCATGGHVENKERFVEETPLITAAYDTKLEELMYTIDEALVELARRATVLTVADQFGRAFASRPSGGSPAPLRGPSDPRLVAWRQKQPAPPNAA